MWSIEKAIERTGTLKEGHFLLSSGLHSGKYLQCAQLLQYPQEAEGAGRALASLFANESIDVVVGPALGGVIIAHEVARALGVPCRFTERKEGIMEMRRGFSVAPGERVLVIEDVVTTGGSVQEVIDLLQEQPVTIVGIGSIVDRTGGHSPFTQPYQALIEIEVDSYSPELCPHCAKGIPVVKPGSRV